MLFHYSLTLEVLRQFIVSPTGISVYLGGAPSTGNPWSFPASRKNPRGTSRTLPDMFRAIG